MEALGLRDRRRRETETELERCALELFAARGFEQVTMGEVADAAGVSTRTAFRYFPAKIDLVLGRLRRIEDAIRPALHGSPTLGELESRIEAAITGVLEDSSAADHLVRAHALMQNDVALRSAAALAMAAPAANSAAPEPHTPKQRLIAEIAAATLRTAFGSWAGSGPDAAPSALLEEYQAMRALRHDLE